MRNESDRHASPFKQRMRIELADDDDDTVEEADAVAPAPPARPAQPAPPPRGNGNGMPPRREEPPPKRPDTSAVFRPVPADRVPPPPQARPPVRQEARPPQQVQPRQPRNNHHVRRIDRHLILRNYNVFSIAFGVICEINSFYTTMFFVWWLWDLMFIGVGLLTYVIGFVVAALLFTGQIFNSDYEVEVENDAGELEVVVNHNRKLAYFAWLTPDAGSTMFFWMVPFFRVFGTIFFGVRIQTEDLRGMIEIGRIAWPNGWQFVLAFMLALVCTLICSAAWGVLSAYYPEKALLGPRVRDLIRDQLDNAQDAIQMALATVKR